MSLEKVLSFSLYRVLFPIIVGIFAIEIYLNLLLEEGIFVELFPRYGLIPYIIIDNRYNLLTTNHLVFPYLIISFLIGTLVTFSSEILLGVFFNMNLYKGNFIESISPPEYRSIGFSDFRNLYTNIFDFSEVNYVIGNLFFSFHILFLKLVLVLSFKIFFNVEFKKFFIQLECIFICVVLIVFIFEIFDKISKKVSKCFFISYTIFLFIASILGFIELIINQNINIKLNEKIYIITLYEITLFSFLLAIRFRTFANKIIYYGHKSLI